MKSPVAIKRAISKRLSKPDQSVEHLDFSDFKVLTAQKMVSSKLDDHLNIFNPENDKPQFNTPKLGLRFFPSTIQKRNPFIEAKLNYMRSQSAKHKNEKKPLPIEAFAEHEEILESRTTFRVERNKQNSIELKSLIELEESLRQSGRKLPNVRSV